MILYDNDDTRKNPALLSPFSLIHLISGFNGIFLLYYINSDQSELSLFNNGIIFHILYEIKDYYYSYVLKYNTELRNNSLLNSCGDIVMGAIGQVLALWFIRYNKNIKTYFRWLIFIWLLLHICFRTTGLN